jgi:hypothetical protein
VHVPEEQVFVVPVQSVFVQQLPAGMHAPAQSVWPLGQPQPDAVQV